MVVYIMRTRHQRRTIHKIGITRNTHQRLANIAQSSHQPVRLISSVWLMWGAARLEKWLHRRYQHRNIPFVGSGKTEWFALGWWALGARAWLWLAWVAQWTLITTLLFIVYLIVKY